MQSHMKVSKALGKLFDGFVDLLVSTAVETVVLKTKGPAAPKRREPDRRCRAQPCPNQGLGPGRRWLCAHHLKSLPPREQAKALERFREKYARA